MTFGGPVLKKKFNLVKTIQLLIFLLITAVVLTRVFTDGELYQMIGKNPSVRLLSILLYLALGLSFVFILWDFSTHNALTKDYKELDYTLYNDRIAGIANRFSCDAMIEKYADSELPENIGCIMLDIANLRDINAQHGHAAGNEAIQAFSDTLYSASLGLCFVGRNGGNKFMALFEDCTEDKMRDFLANVSRKLETRNAQGDAPAIEYRSGRAFNAEDHVPSITRLIGLADRRLVSRGNAANGLTNRSGCDEIIEFYADKPLTVALGCVCFEISNIREINEKVGRLAGNDAIRSFWEILCEAARGEFVVGRNGGICFMAILEDLGPERMDAYVREVSERVDVANKADRGANLSFTYGCAHTARDDIKSINELIVYANRRMHGENI